MKFKNYRILFLVILFLSTNLSADISNNKVNQEAAIENIYGKKIKLARKLLLKFAQLGVDLINEYKIVGDELALVHDESITSDQGFSLKKVFTSGEWEKVLMVKVVEDSFELLVQNLILESDFLINDSLKEEEFLRELNVFLRVASDFCISIGINVGDCTEESNLDNVLKNIEIVINKLQEEIRAIEESPTLLGRAKNLFWGSNFSYNVLPAVLGIAEPIASFIKALKRSANYNKEIDINVKKELLAEESNKVDAQMKYLFGMRRDDLLKAAYHIVVQVYKELQSSSYHRNQIIEKEKLKRKQEQVKKSTEKQIKFNDVVGYEKEKQQLGLVIEALKNPLKFKRFGINVPRGVLFSGDPGTGKTFFARAITGEAKCSCWAISASDLIGDKDISSLQKINDLFDRAEACAPSIIFIDEIDFIGSRKRSESMDYARSIALANLLTKLNGFKPRNPFRPVLVIAATNSPQDLDEALIRSGRFDIHVHVNLPDANTRRAIIEKELQNSLVSNKTLDIEAIVKLTENCSFADIFNIINCARMKFGFSSNIGPSLEDFEFAMHDVQKNRLTNVNA